MPNTTQASTPAEGTTTSAASAGTNNYQLEALVLHHCAVSRGDAAGDLPGSVSGDQSIEHSFAEGLLIYIVSNTLDFTNENEGLVARIEVAFAAAYRVGDTEPPADDIRIFTSSVILQMTPFVREFAATMTNRLGIHPFLLPLVRQSEIKLVESDDENAADA